jgi:hypothetical protein
MIGNLIDLIDKIRQCPDGRSVVLSNLLAPYYELFNQVKRLIMRIYLSDNKEANPDQFVASNKARK